MQAFTPEELAAIGANEDLRAEIYDWLQCKTNEDAGSIPASDSDTADDALVGIYGELSRIAPEFEFEIIDPAIVEPGLVELQFSTGQNVQFDFRISDTQIGAALRLLANNEQLRALAKQWGAIAHADISVERIGTSSIMGYSNPAQEFIDAIRNCRKAALSTIAGIEIADSDIEYRRNHREASPQQLQAMPWALRYPEYDGSYGVYLTVVLTTFRGDVCINGADYIDANAGLAELTIRLR